MGVNMEAGNTREVTTSGGKKLSAAQREQLILDHGEQAQKLGMKLLKGWGARMAGDDFISAVDLALCEAASRYTPVDQATFATYLFYFIKGELIETFKQQGRPIAPET